MIQMFVCTISPIMLILGTYSINCVVRAPNLGVNIQIIRLMEGQTTNRLYSTVPVNFLKIASRYKMAEYGSPPSFLLYTFVS